MNKDEQQEAPEQEDPTPDSATQLKQIEEALERDPDNEDLLVEISRHYHRQAMQGDDEAFGKANRSIASLLRINKKHVEGLAIAGSLLTIKARRSGSLVKRMCYSMAAARKLDKAVKLDPANVTARTIRAFTALVLPGFLRRIATAAGDFEYLIEMKQEDPSLLPDEMMPKVMLNLGLAYAKMRERERATEILSVVMDRFPGTREYNRAKALLHKLQQRGW
jgi:tetratricopeptide (TPR) repeat protein